MILKNCFIVVGTGEVREQADIEVREGKITGIGKDLVGDQILDVKGKTVMPGFIDTHVHLMLSGEEDPYDAMKQSDEMLTLVCYQNAYRTLQAGFTTICDKGARGSVGFAVRDAINRGLLPGPRLIVCGRMICMTGGHGHWLGGREADGVDECRKAAREQLKNGADFLKIMATGGVLTRGSDPDAYQLEIEEMRAIVHEAHKVGKKTAAHAINSAGVINAVKAGIDTVEHASRADEEAIKLMAEHEVPMAVTISSAAQEVSKGPDWIREKATPNLKGKKTIIEYAKKVGARIILGTDAGTPYNEHGENAHEFEFMVDRGLSIEEAVRAGTGYAAEALGIAHEVGTVEAGKRADLVVVDGNPLIDISVLSKGLLYVIKDGQIVSR
jgi:imidazolonepropionase-like amidohydrolase